MTYKQSGHLDDYFSQQLSDKQQTSLSPFPAITDKGQSKTNENKHNLFLKDVKLHRILEKKQTNAENKKLLREIRSTFKMI